MNKKYTIFIISIFLTSSFLVLNNLSVSKLPVDTSQKNTQIKANQKVNRESKAKINVNKQSKSKIGELHLSAKSQTSYTNHIPIIIFGDSGFSTVSGITGSGTSSDPYVINGFNITSTGTLISIQNTDKYVLIENCWLDGEQDPNSIGINLSKTLQVTIEFNEIYYLSEGIWGTSANYTNIGWNNIVLGTPYGDSVNIANSFSVQLTQNLVDSVTSNSGFYIASTLNVYINKNNIYNVNEGIIGINDDRLEVIGNKIEVPSIGIDIEGGVDFVTIENNTLISPTNIAVNQPTNIGIQIMYLFVGSFLNNAITNADTSMLFLGSSNNIIEGNNITNSLTDALDIGSSNNNLVKGNVITDSGAHGIYILSSKKNNIINNTISGLIGTADGVLLENSNFNNITSNIIEKSDTLLSIQQSDLNNITNCNFLESYGNGTEIINSIGNMIFNSTFDSSTDLGVVLLNGTADRVIENIFMGAHDYSIFLDREYGALIEYNEFNGQGHFLGSQAFDDGINRFIYNYWADFTTPDKNGDGIVDKPYPIDGPSFIFDPMPLTSISEIASIVSSSWTFPSTSNPITVVVVLNSSNLLNSITNTTSKGTSGLPGLTLPSLVVGFIALGIMIMIRRRKNN